MVEVIIFGTIFLILCFWVYKKKSFIGAVLLYLSLVALIAAMVNHSYNAASPHDNNIKIDSIRSGK